MGKLSAENAQYLLTRNVIPRHTLESVTRRALEVCAADAAAAGAAARRLRRLVRETVEVPGYDEPWDAPEDALQGAVLATLPQSSALCRAILRVWAATEADLREQVTAYLAERAAEGLSIPGPGWSPAVMRTAVDDIRRRRPDLAHNDVALMICWLADYVPLPEQAAPQVEVGRSTGLGDYLPRWEPLEAEPPRSARGDGTAHWQIIFREVLEGLRQLAADSAVWAAASRFAESLRQLIDEKAAERAAARSALQAAIDDLARDAGDDLTFFGLDEVRRWRPDRAPLDSIPDLTARVATLRRILRDHRALQAAPTATVTEQLTQRLRLQTLESAAFETYGRLCAVLSAAAAPVPEPGTPEPLRAAGEVPPPAPETVPAGRDARPAPAAATAPGPAEQPEAPFAGAPAEPEGTAVAAPLPPTTAAPATAEQEVPAVLAAPAPGPPAAEPPAPGRRPETAAATDVAPQLAEQVETPNPEPAAPPQAPDGASLSGSAIPEESAAPTQPEASAAQPPTEGTTVEPTAVPAAAAEEVPSEQPAHPLPSTAEGPATEPPGALAQSAPVASGPAGAAPEPELAAATGPYRPAAPAASPEEASASAWFTDMAGWEPLPRQRRATEERPLPARRGGLRGLLDRIAAFLGLSHSG